MKADPYLISPELTINLNGIPFPLEYLYRHLLIVGQPGAGKTRCVLMPLLREILEACGTENERKAAMVVFDPKNELGDFMQKLAVEFGRQDDLIFFKPGTAFYNPLSNPFLTDSEIIEKIVLYGSNTNRDGSQHTKGEAYWANAQRALLSAVVSVSRTLYGTLTYQLLNETFDYINRFPSVTAAQDWLNDHSFSASARQGIQEFLRLPSESTRPCVATSVANVLYLWKAEPLLCLTTPRDGVPTIDPFQVIDAGKILVISCASAAYGASITPLLLALKEHVFTSILSRDQIEVDEEGITRQLNQERPVFVVGDEFQAYLSSNSNAGELVALDRMRSARAGYIAATQNLASIFSVMNDHAHATRLISLFSNQVHMANLCPYTAQSASTLMGVKTKNVVQHSEEKRIAPPLMVGREKYRPAKARNRTIVPRQVPRVDASTLAKMKTGEFWMRLASGQVCRGKAKPVIESGEMHFKP